MDVENPHVLARGPCRHRWISKPSPLTWQSRYSEKWSSLEYWWHGEASRTSRWSLAKTHSPTCHCSWLGVRPSVFIRAGPDILTWAQLSNKVVVACCALPIAPITNICSHSWFTTWAVATNAQTTASVPACFFPLYTLAKWPSFPQVLYVASPTGHVLYQADASFHNSHIVYRFLSQVGQLQWCHPYCLCHQWCQCWHQQQSLGFQQYQLGHNSRIPSGRELARVCQQPYCLLKCVGLNHCH